MPLNLPDDGQAVDDMAAIVGGHGAVLHYVLELVLHGGGLFRSLARLRAFVTRIRFLLRLIHIRSPLTASVRRRRGKYASHAMNKESSYHNLRRRTPS